MDGMSLGCDLRDLRSFVTAFGRGPPVPPNADLQSFNVRSRLCRSRALVQHAVLQVKILLWRLLDDVLQPERLVELRSAWWKKSMINNRVETAYDGVAAER